MESSLRLRSARDGMILFLLNKMVNWKKPRKVYRVHCRSTETVTQDDGNVYVDEHHWVEDILESELNADLMSDLHCYYGWLWCTDQSDWEIVDVEELEIWSAKELRIDARWRSFNTRFGMGEDLHV
jgi:hypothetical protein